ncbi:ABC transporter permease subunit [Alkaliphilus sp. B6464]|nr:ABC transporter permease subunit [Alkaliphilus sp. B6464]
MNAQQKQVNRMVHATKMKDRRAWKNSSGKDFNYHTPIAIIILGIIWMIAARIVNKPFIFPSLESVIEAFFKAITDLYVLRNIGITIRRVMTGVFYAFIIGLPIGMIMGYSQNMLRAFAPFINSLRQVPIMAWVPLSIIWFGLGDGPTIFMIAFTGIFTVILNTIAGVQDISKEYYHAARSMGARTIDIIKDIVLPGSLPGIITGIRLAIGLGWMSVI